MDRKTADLIIEAAGEIGVEVELREDYSGRGMYGENTTAIVMDDPMELLLVCLHIGATHPELVEEIGEDLRRIRTDSMGRYQQVVY